MIADAPSRERQRLAFVEARDGPGGAAAFARQTLHIYRSALARRNQAGFRCGYGLEYRRELVGSCLALRAYLRTAGAEARGHPS